MRKIRVLRLRGMVWVELCCLSLSYSRDGLGGAISREGLVWTRVPKRESAVGGLLHCVRPDACCLAERGSKAPGSKYLPRNCQRQQGCCPKAGGASN